MLIIGAGIAGASAAYWLKKFGITSLILEGQGRIGGRLKTSTLWPGAALDVGGAWIHDSLNSPLTPLVQQFGIKTSITDFSFVMYDNTQPPSLKQVDEATFLTIVADFLQLEARVAARTTALAGQGVPDQQLQNVYNSVLASMNLPQNITAGVQVILDNRIRIAYGADLWDLSLYNFDQDNQNVIQFFDRAFPNDPATGKAGYVQLVQALFNAAGQKINLNCPIQQINYGAQGVTVTCNGQTFTAPYCIVTVPLGVLKRAPTQTGHISFNPALPVWKQGAIDRLGMGRFDKFPLLFQGNFWGGEQVLRNTLSTSQFTIWLNANAANNPLTNQPVLVPVVFGDFAKSLEGLSDTDVLKKIMAVLQGWFGAKVTPLKSFQRTRWGADPYAYGSYSHIPPGASAADYDTMAMPLPSTSPCLFFAGEATHRTHPGGAWGAYESGLREASRIYRIINGGTPPRAPSQPAQGASARSVFRALDNSAAALKQQTSHQLPAAVVAPRSKQPNFAAASGLREQGTALLGTGDYTAAVDTLCQAIQQNPTDWLAYNERGAALTFQNKDAEAIRDLTMAIALDAKQPIPYRNRGAAYLRQGKYTEALADLNRSIKLKPDYARAYRDRSAVQCKLGHSREADQDQQEAARLEKAAAR